ncbi:AEC family transporter [Pelagibius sp. Alg239-R121]|uniref:AEC family transporter n=1 Tax=Pelagibius sp. Alg239-R121 TaxID=2993448 RepID=UPI0024A6BAD8|nr:AEC family transporter [Pelagibius sp. Alg239-R121]
MGPILDATLPIFLLILVGFLLRWRGFIERPAWEAVEKLTYMILFPALLIRTLATTDFGSLQVLPIVAAINTPLILTALILMTLVARFTNDGPALTSMLQGFIRPNTYIGLAVAASLFGEVGFATATLAIAASVPLVNLLSVVALSRHGNNGTRSLGGMLLAIVKNPIIVACALGILLNVTAVGLPSISDPFLEILGRAALPLGLIAVGAGLELRNEGGALGALVAPIVGKLVVLPIITAFACGLFGVTGVGAYVAILFNALPAASSSFILARQLGGDAALMARIITIQTAAAMITLPILLGLLV